MRKYSSIPTQTSTVSILCSLGDDNFAMFAQFERISQTPLTGWLPSQPCTAPCPHAGTVPNYQCPSWSRPLPWALHIFPSLSSSSNRLLFSHLCKRIISVTIAVTCTSPGIPSPPFSPLSFPSFIVKVLSPAVSPSYSQIVCLQLSQTSLLWWNFSCQVLLCMAVSEACPWIIILLGH